MSEKLKGTITDDGKSNIILYVGDSRITIEEGCYKAAGLSFEKMQEKETLASFLTILAMSVIDLDVNALMESKKNRLACAVAKELRGECAT